MCYPEGVLVHIHCAVAWIMSSLTYISRVILSVHVYVATIHPGFIPSRATSHRLLSGHSPLRGSDPRIGSIKCDAPFSVLLIASKSRLVSERESAWRVRALDVETRHLARPMSRRFGLNEVHESATTKPVSDLRSLLTKVTPKDSAAVASCWE